MRKTAMVIICTVSCLLCQNLSFATSVSVTVDVPGYYYNYIVANSEPYHAEDEDNEIDRKAAAKAQAYWWPDEPYIGVYGRAGGRGVATLYDKFTSYPSGQISYLGMALRVKLNGLLRVPIGDQGSWYTSRFSIQVSYTDKYNSNRIVGGTLYLEGQEYRPTLYVDDLQVPPSSGLFHYVLNPSPTINTYNYPLYPYYGDPCTSPYYGAVSLNGYVLTIPLEDFSSVNPMVSILMSAQTSDCNTFVNFYDTLEFADDEVGPIALLDEQGDVVPLPPGSTYQLGENAPIETVPELCEGDFEPDADVDGIDLAVFADAFGSVSGGPNYNPDADFDGDGYVDESDLAVFAADFGRTDCPNQLPG